MAGINMFLENMRVFNEHGLLSHFGDLQKDVWIYFRAPSRGRTGGTFVASPSHHVDPKGHWSDNGAKWFPGGMLEGRPQAEAWASEQYHIESWVSSPFCRSARVPGYVMERVRAKMKENL